MLNGIMVKRNTTGDNLPNKNIAKAAANPMISKARMVAFAEILLLSFMYNKGPKTDVSALMAKNTLNIVGIRPK